MGYGPSKTMNPNFRLFMLLPSLIYYPLPAKSTKTFLRITNPTVFSSLFSIDLSFCSSSFFLISRMFVHKSFRKDGSRNSWSKASQLLGWIWMNLTIQSIILLKNLRHKFYQYHSPESDFPADFSGPYITGTF